MTNYQKPDMAVVDAIGRALDAELKGEPKQWFVTRENHRGGLKLGIGMFNPGICRVADMFYHGEPTDAHRRYAALIVAAVNACYQVNPQNPFGAARSYPSFVAAAKALTLEAWRYDDEIKTNERVYHVSAETLQVIEELLTSVTEKAVA